MTVYRKPDNALFKKARILCDSDTAAGEKTTQLHHRQIHLMTRRSAVAQETRKMTRPDPTTVTNTR